MEDIMLANTTRNFFILIIAMYSFYKLLNLNFPTIKTSFFLIVSSFIICFASTLLFFSNLSLNRLCILLMLFVLMKLSTNLRFFIVYVTTLFSFALSIIAFNLAGIIIGLILLPFQYGNYTLPWFLIRIGVGILQFFLLYCCFHIPRLKKGMTFLYNVPSNNIGSTFCFFAIISVIIYGQFKTFNERFTIYIYATIFILGFLLIYWWNYHITQTYRRYLKKNEINSLNILLEEKNKEIAFLRSDNDRLARAIHKDNKIIPIICNAVLDSNDNRIPLDLSQWETGSPLALKLKQLYDDRCKILEEHKHTVRNVPQTAFDFTNATISFMYSEAKKSGIPFQVVLFDDLRSTIPEIIKEDDFNHLLSDLLANALNACANISDASIVAYLGKTEKTSTIRICNTGNVFHMETLKNLGLCRHTTHPDTGGSGIGLMDIWMLKEKYKATLLIDEITDGSSSEIYTCVNILFNHKNRYIIQSDRHKTLSTYINRPDAMILGKE